MKIMIVEDDPVSLALLTKSLGKTEPSIITAKTGTQAWEQFTTAPPRIVISDWMLPELSGIELCNKIRESQTMADTDIITVNNNNTDQEKCNAGIGRGANYLRLSPAAQPGIHEHHGQCGAVH